jgi:N,N-dimethylformamidase
MLLAYSDKLTMVGGDTLAVKVSSTGTYTSSLVRLHGMAASGEGIAVTEEALESDSNGEHPGRVQALHPGSYVVVDLVGGIDFGSGISVSLWIKPTMPGGKRQTLVEASASHGGAAFRLEIDQEGHIVVSLWSSMDACIASARIAAATEDNVWALVEAAHDLQQSNLRVRSQSVHGERAAVQLVSNAPGFVATRLLFGATAGSHGYGIDTFEGRIAEPKAWSVGDKLIGAWDFSQHMAGTVAVEAGGTGHDGRIVNRPGRAVLGPHWDRKTLVWTEDPIQWNALHLHSNDLDDAEWETDFSVTTPSASGIYAVRLAQGSEVYYVPFFVNPGTSRKRVLYIAPSNTYLAYGNEHLWEGERGDAHQKLMSFPIKLDDAEKILQAHPELGRSIYDTHADGSGVHYTSRLRPLTNFQPNYMNWLVGGPRHFSADFFITGWLNSIGVEFDVATEESVHVEGVDLLKPYDVIITGSHPEYPSTEGLEAYEAYALSGGNIMYLGANGFYWVASYLDESRSGIESRRGYSTVRNWSSHPAELHHSSNGERGGSYRHRGRDQNPIFGVGMCGAGWGPGSGFKRTAESYDLSVSWAFEGIDAEMLGEHGYLLGGAAGDELDQTSATRGTPKNTVVLMSSEHGDFFFPSLEQVSEIGPNMEGSKNPGVRADVALVTHPGGGRVFSASSICWAGSLGTNSYSNDIAQLSTNVIRRFLQKK